MTKGVRPNKQACDYNHPVICEEVVATTNIASWEIHGNPKVNKKNDPGSRRSISW